MSTLQAGFGKTKLDPRIGCIMLGFDDFACSSQHDDLFVRVMVLEQDGQSVCLISLDQCLLVEPTIAAIRAAVAARTAIPIERILVCTTHTHSAPDGNRADSFLTPLGQSCAEAAAAAIDRLRPAAIATGYGALHGYSINRRWIHRPIDPAVTVLRVDDLSGRPLGAVTNFGCHAVVLGMKNRSLSGDYPGFAMSRLESAIGPETVCLFTQGGSGDVNPLDARVRAQLTSGEPVQANGGPRATYYGQPGENPHHMGLIWSEGDAATFGQVAEMGSALADECLRVFRGLSPGPADARLWVKHLDVAAGLKSGEEYISGVRVTEAWKKARISRLGCKPDEHRRMDLMSFGLSAVEGGKAGELMFLGIPAEVFSETAVQLRRILERGGAKRPFIIGYANGFNMYLPPADAFAEGGYETETAMDMLHSPNLTQRIMDAARELV